MPLSKKQLAMRPKALWASEIIALFPEYAPAYAKNILEVYAEKTGIGRLRDHSNQATAAGKFWEDTIARAWAKENGYKIQRAYSAINDETHGLPLGATPDRLARKIPLKNDTPFEGLECKNVGIQESDLWNEPAYHVLIQVATQALVWDFPRVHIAICIGGVDRRSYTYERNDELEKIIIDRGRWFWKEIIEPRAWHERLPELPEITEEIKRRFLIKLFPTNGEPPIQATAKDFGIFEGWVRAKKNLERWKEAEKQYGNMALEQLRNASAVIGPDGKKLFSKVVREGKWVERFYREETVYPMLNLPRKHAEVYQNER